MPSVLVTGGARGIGRDIVTHLAAAGWDVIAGVRSDGDAAAIKAENPQRISTVLLDITNTEHIAVLETSLPDRLDAVVNNAGISVPGPVETITAADLRRQFDVNLFGQVAVTQAVLPRLRRSQGRLVFISSMSGRVVSPLLGPYSASKFALEATADALRMELAPWKIRVVLVEPAQTDTDMWRTADTVTAEMESALSDEQRSLYGRHFDGMKKSVTAMQKMAVPPADVAVVVEKALTARRPRARYVVGLGPKVQAAAAASAPTAVRDRVLRLVMHQP